MTGSKTFAGMVLCLMITAVVGSPPSAGNVTVHEAAFDGCHFDMKDPYGATLQATERSTPALANYNAEINPKARHPFETWIQFDCENNVSLNDLPKLAGVAKENGQ